MSNIVNRFLVTGKRTDNGEMVTGYYLGATGYLKWHDIYDSNSIHGTRREIDPATIEPIAVKVLQEVREDGHTQEWSGQNEYLYYDCPNCGETIGQEGEYGENHEPPKYCSECGQRLDWSNADWRGTE